VKSALRACWDKERAGLRISVAALPDRELRENEKTRVAVVVDEVQVRAVGREMI